METRERDRREEWFDAPFVENWLAQQEGRSSERLGHFAIIRSVIPRQPNEPFRYLNLGAGDGWLDEVLLTRFTRAEATLLDGSDVMVDHAKKRLQAFSGRATVVQGNLATAEWQRAVQPPYDAVVSSIAIHNLFDPALIRGLYAQVFEVVAEGGLFMNLDYMRPVTAMTSKLARWAGSDPEVTYSRRRAGGGGGSRGSLEEQLIWFRDAGFSPVDCVWKEFHTALIVGLKGAVTIPEER